MAKHELNPEPGHWWYSPQTGENFHVTAVTDDGWVRFFKIGEHSPEGVLYTLPTLDFIRCYRKMSTYNLENS